MPWLGKSFDPLSQTGVNRFTAGARVPLRMMWPTYRPEGLVGGRLEAFPFRTWVGRGALDPDIDVLKIHYDSEPNPKFPIRRILDELVQVGKGQYLGKVLLWWKGSFRRVGFFSLAT